jgi:plastocyanin
MKVALFMLGTILGAAGTAQAEDYVLTLKDHQFTPANMVIPAGQKIKLTIDNQDPTPAEFESFDLQREKVVGANSSIAVFIGPMDAGTYSFFDDFHRDTTTGTLIAQ